MIEPSIKPLLLAQGFSVDERNDLVFVTFPDGHDGRVFEAGQLLEADIEPLLGLGRDRKQAIMAITALFADMGWGMQPDGVDRMKLGWGAASSAISFGVALTYWLQRDGLRPAVRRFAEAFGSDISDGAIEKALSTDASAESARLFKAHLATVAEIEANAVDFEADPAEQAKTQAQIDLYRKEAVEEHLKWLNTHHIDGALAEKMTGVLQNYRSEILGGRGMWLGADPLWMSDTDNWITREEWVEWGEFDIHERALEGSGAIALMRFAPEQYSTRIRELLIGAHSRQELEFDRGEIALALHFLDERALADFAVSPFEKMARSSDLVATIGLHALFGPYARLSAAMKNQATMEMRPWLGEIEEILKDAGTIHFARLLAPDERERLIAACHAFLDEPIEMETASIFAQIVSLIALGLNDRGLADRLLGEPFWQSALLHRLNLGDISLYLALKESILALSLVAPGVNCRNLVARAAEHLDDAYEQHIVDTTALALAIAWHRCKAART